MVTTSGTIYFCNTCQLYLRYEEHCNSCDGPAAKLGWMVSNED